LSTIYFYDEKVLMQISVVIPVYNREHLIQRAIDSVLNQTEKPFEIIVVNDGSTDKTKDSLKKYQNRIQIIEQKNQGVSAARNAGIRSANGDWVAFLDSDDEWLPEKIGKAIEFHHKFLKYRIFQTDEIWIRNGKRVNPKHKHEKFGGWIFKQSLPLCIVSPSAVVIEKDLLSDVGYFDENLPVCEDYDLWLRISRNYQIGLDEYKGIYKYGGHSDQLSRKYWGMDYYRILAMEKHLKDLSLPEKQRQWVLNEVVNKLNILIFQG